MKQQTTGQSMIKGAMILAVASFLSKIIGMVYTIPLTYTLGDEGNFIYNSAFNVYVLLLTVSAVGVPTAISKLIAERTAVGAYREAQRVYKVALLYSGILGGLLSIGLWIGAEEISWAMFKTYDIALPLKALAPTIMVVSIMAVMRGYLQGLNKMGPTGISQVVEQLVNAIFSIVLAHVLLSRGLVQAATGSTLGTGIGAIAGLIVILMAYFLIRPTMRRKILKSKKGAREKKESTLEILKVILWTVVPIVLSSSIFSVMANIDNSMLAHMLPKQIGILRNEQMLHLVTEPVQPQFEDLKLAHEVYNLRENRYEHHYKDKESLLIGKAFTLGVEVYERANYSNVKISKELIGQYTGKYMKLINVPVSLILTLAMASIPTFSAAMAKKNFKEIRRKTKLILKIGTLFAAPAAVGLTVFAFPIMKVLYGDVSDGAEMLIVGSIAIIFITLAQLTAGVLQGIGKQHIPTLHAAIACMIKIAVNFILLQVAVINIYSVIISTTLCYVVFAWLNMWYLKKQIGIRYGWKKLILKPVLCAMIMGLIGISLYGLFSLVISNKGIILILVIPVCMIVYGLIGLITGTITRRDIEYMPGGTKILNRFF